MILTGTTTGPKGETRHRVTRSRESGARVRQLSEQSEDSGKTWQVAFDGTYSRKR